MTVSSACSPSSLGSTNRCLILAPGLLPFYQVCPNLPASVTLLMLIVRQACLDFVETTMF